jgi:hypothetical protein
MWMLLKDPVRLKKVKDSLKGRGANVRGDSLRRKK